MQGPIFCNPHTKMPAAVSIGCDEARPTSRSKIPFAGSLAVRRNLLPWGVGLFQIDLPSSIGGTGQQPGQIPPVGHQFILRLHVHLRFPCSRCLAVPDRWPIEHKSSVTRFIITNRLNELAHVIPQDRPEFDRSRRCRLGSSNRHRAGRGFEESSRPGRFLVDKNETGNRAGFTQTGMSALLAHSRSEIGGRYSPMNSRFHQAPEARRSARLVKR